MILLRTERLVLRQFTESDVDNLTELDSDPEVMRYLTGGRPTPREVIRDRTLPRFLDYYARHGDRAAFAAIERSTGGFLGWFALRPAEEGEIPDVEPGDLELGYRLRRSAWGKGYATEGSLALVHKGFGELGARRVVATTMAVNAASRRVMEKAGLVWVSTFHGDWPDPIEGSEHGEVVYALTRQSWATAVTMT